MVWLKPYFIEQIKYVSPEVFQTLFNVIKGILLKSGYPNPLIDKVLITEISRLNYINPFLPRNV